MVKGQCPNGPESITKVWQKARSQFSNSQITLDADSCVRAKLQPAEDHCHDANGPTCDAECLDATSGVISSLDGSCCDGTGGMTVEECQENVKTMAAMMDAMVKGQCPNGPESITKVWQKARSQFSNSQITLDADSCVRAKLQPAEDHCHDANGPTCDDECLDATSGVISSLDGSCCDGTGGMTIEECKENVKTMAAMMDAMVKGQCPNGPESITKVLQMARSQFSNSKKASLTREVTITFFVAAFISAAFTSAAIHFYRKSKQVNVQ